jgi:hypothetical protein
VSITGVHSHTTIGRSDREATREGDARAGQLLESVAGATLQLVHAAAQRAETTGLYMYVWAMMLCGNCMGGDVRMYGNCTLYGRNCKVVHVWEMYGRACRALW